MIEGEGAGAREKAVIAEEAAGRIAHNKTRTGAGLPRRVRCHGLDGLRKKARRFGGIEFFDLAWIFYSCEGRAFVAAHGL